MGNLKYDREKALADLDAWAKATVRQVEDMAGRMREEILTSADALRTLPERSIDILTSASVALVKDMTVRAQSEKLTSVHVEVQAGWGERFNMHDGSGSVYPRIPPGRYRALFFLVPIEPAKAHEEEKPGQGSE